MTEKRRIAELIEHEDGTVTVKTSSLDELTALILLHPEACKELLPIVQSMVEKKGACPSELI